MAEMSEKTLEMWRTRLRQAREVWEKHGLIGMSEPSTMRTLIEYYRGEQWRNLGGFWKGLNGSDLVTVNKIYSITNASIAGLASRDPEVVLIPRNREAQDHVNAATALLNYDIDEQNMMRQWNRAVMDHHFAPFGCVRHGFTAREEMVDDQGRKLEFYRPARADRPWIKRLPVWDVLLPPLSESFDNDGSMKWCAFRDMKPVTWFRRNPNMISRDGLKPNVGSPFREMRPDELLDERNEDWLDLVEFYWVYEIEERTWFAITLDDGVARPLRDPEDFPIPWEWLPIDIFSVHEQMDTPFAKPLMEEIVPIQDELNQLRTIMHIVVRNTRRILAASSDMETDELDKLEDGEIVEILRTGGPPNQVLQEIRSGGFPVELLSYEQLLNQDMREVKGQSQMDRAQRINVQTAQEASQVQRGSNIQASAESAAFENFLNSSVRNYMHGRQATMSDEELIPILGAALAEGGEKFRSVAPEDIRQDYDFKIVAGSTAPEDLNQRARETMGDIEVAAKFQTFHDMREILTDYWVERRKDVSRMMVSPQQQQAADAAGAAQEAAEGPRTGGVVPEALLRPNGGN
jgi:hypothetical protein